MQSGGHCQACETAKATERFDPADDLEPYQLCSPCLNRLEAYALRPIECYNLLARYGNYRHHLHDDFYDEDCIASQPLVEVAGSSQFAAPKLPDVASDAHKLVRYSLTRWSLDAATRDAFRKHPPRAVLEIISPLATSENWLFKVKCLELCGDVIGPMASGIVLSLRDRGSGNAAFYAWAAAVALCFAEDEGFRLVCEALEAELPQPSPRALVWFRSSKTLDWMEQRVPKNEITSNWGEVAAYSQLSWDRARTWLERGRPLNLVAVDALKTCFLVQYPDSTMRLRDFRPNIDRLPVNPLDVVATLKICQQADPWPRNQKGCQLIIDNIGELYRKNPPKAYG